MGVSRRSSLPSFLKLWWTNIRIRLLVILMAFLGVIDGFFTSIWIERHGIEAEVNPLARWLFGSELAIVWLLTNVFVSFFCGVILASSCLILENGKRRLVALLSSLLVAARTVVDGFYVIYYFGLGFLGPIVFALGAVVFIASRNILIYGHFGSLSGLFNVLSNYRRDLTLTLATARIALFRLAQQRANVETSRSTEHVGKSDLARRLRGRSLILWVAAIVITPILTLSLIQALTILSGTQSLPRWLRSLGIVTAIQGQLFLVSFILIIAMLIVLFYAFSSIFEILAETRQK